MRSRLRRLLLIVLMLGLPVQTFAGTSMLVCASAHPATPVAVVMDHAAMAGCHESEPLPPPSHDCKHCKVCGLASALPIPASHALRSIEVSTRYHPVPAKILSGVIPDGPERPPRTRLA